MKPRQKTERRNVLMLEALRNLMLDRLDVDEAISLSAFARSLKAEYEHCGAEAPQWLDDKTRELRSEIRDRLRDSVQKRLREAKSRLESLATPEEKRDRLRKEIEDLEKLAV